MPCDILQPVLRYILKVLRYILNWYQLPTKLKNLEMPSNWFQENFAFFEEGERVEDQRRFRIRTQGAGAPPASPPGREVIENLIAIKLGRSLTKALLIKTRVVAF